MDIYVPSLYSAHTLIVPDSEGFIYNKTIIEKILSRYKKTIYTANSGTPILESLYPSNNGNEFDINLSSLSNCEIYLHYG